LAEADRGPGVVPLVARSESQEQPLPRVAVKFTPLEGFVLFTENVCEAGAAPPIWYVPNGSEFGVTVSRVEVTVNVAVTVGLGETPAALKVRIQV
jgi:hypothetical protein